MSETIKLHPPAWASLAPALRSRNFRLFWLAQLVSTTGTSLQVVAEGWLIYQITESTFWLGAVGLIGLLPVVPVALLGGLIIDRVPRRKLIMLTQGGLMLQAGIFGLLALTSQVQLWHVITLYFIFGAILAIDHPARRAFLVDLVPSHALANAVALNATLFNVANLVGFAASGFLIAALGAGGTMTLNAVSYITPIIALGLIRAADTRSDTQPQPLKLALLEGGRILWQQPAILAVIGLMAVAGGLAWPVFGLMPAFAAEVMRTDSVGLGLLLTAGAVGSILGTVIVARLAHRQRGQAMLIAGGGVALLVIGLAFTRSMLQACLVLIPLGALLLVVQSLAITLVQVNIPDRVRGRVMTIYSMLHAGSDTMGNVAVGALAVPIGLPPALGLGGLLALLFITGLAILVPALRRLD